MAEHDKQWASRERLFSARPFEMRNARQGGPRQDGDGSLPDQGEEQATENEPLLAAIRSCLASLPEHAREIGLRRMGFAPGLPQSLDGIADDLGVHRERVRQIEAKVQWSLKQRIAWWSRLKDKLDALRREQAFPLSLKDIEASDPWFEGICDAPEALLSILKTFCGKSAEILTIDGVAYLASLSQKQWDRALAQANRLIAARTVMRIKRAGLAERARREGNWTEVNCRALVEALIPEESREFRGLLWGKVVGRCQFGFIAASHEQVCHEQVLVAFNEAVDRRSGRRRPHHAANACPPHGFVRERGVILHGKSERS